VRAGRGDDVDDFLAQFIEEYSAHLFEFWPGHFESRRKPGRLQLHEGSLTSAEIMLRAVGAQQPVLGDLREVLHRQRVGIAHVDAVLLVDCATK